MTRERQILEVDAPASGWHSPWPNVAELATRLDASDWTLVGGLMVELHATAAGITPPRVTVDVDLVVHTETARGRVARVAATLDDLGCKLAEPSRESGGAHRFVRTAEVRGDARDIVDVLAADHAAPRVREPLLGRDMVAIEGGTQALRRTVNARLDVDGARIVVSVPDTLGALILKSAAHQADSRDRARHLLDAVVLLACMADPVADRERLTSGSDRPRILRLARALRAPAHRAWTVLPDDDARRARFALDILARD